MILRRFARYVVPSVVGSAVTSLYLVVDGVFIARGVGETGVAAVTLVLPLTMAFVAISMVFSVGGASRVSISRGSDDPDRAVSIFRQSVCALMIIGAVFSLVGAALADDIAVALGATGRLRLPEATLKTLATHSSGAWMLALTCKPAVTPSKLAVEIAPSLLSGIRTSTVSSVNAGG